MARKAGPGAAQQTCFSYGRMAMQNDALTKTDSDRVAVHTHPVAGFNLYPAIQFDMRVKMRGALFDFNAARRVKGFGG